MKKLFILLLIMGCEPVPHSDVSSVPTRKVTQCGSYQQTDVEIDVVTIDDHDYILARRCEYGLCLIHSESCRCKQK